MSSPTTNPTVNDTCPPTDGYPSANLFPCLVRDLTIDVVERLDIDSLIRLRHISSLADDWVSSVLQKRLGRALNGLVRNPTEFLDGMGAFGAVISGDAACAVLFPHTTPPPSTLHIYTPHATYDAFVEHLKANEGFKWVPIPRKQPAAGVNPWVEAAPEDIDSPLMPRGVGKWARYQRGDAVAEVYCASGNGALSALIGQWHSGLFNYVSATTFCAAYPKLTNQRRGLLNPSRLHAMTRPYRDVRKFMDEWEDKGWEMSREWGPWAEGRCAGNGLDVRGTPTSVVGSSE
ncbi:hypothetical protein C8Q76DRAFT_789637 [Earliella scabrosa]|nr:hypothetical protein C8Q76DRAFT_789637 [Earliella scabrosa]